MFLIIVESSFNASHQIDFAESGPEPLHCHNWKVEVGVCTEELDKDGLGIDFHILKAKTDDIIGQFEGKKLEDSEIFKDMNASAENVAKYIYETLESETGSDVQLRYVEVTEEKGCRVRYSK